VDAEGVRRYNELGGEVMAAPLSEEQRQALSENCLPLRIADEQSKQVFYLISAEQYERARKALEEEEVDPSYFEFTDFTGAPSERSG
jgi:hypothetical protein